MKVTHSGGPPVHGGEVAGNKGAEKAEKAEKSERVHSASKAAGPAGPAHTENADAQAQISPKSKEFAQAKAVAVAAPDVREERVMDLKNRIASGEYSVNAESIADRLVDEHVRMPRVS
jgi:negative regulator of flagellin synthesis FlgM